jgi:hypothetical protein
LKALAEITKLPCRIVGRGFLSTGSGNSRLDISIAAQCWIAKKALVMGVAEQG